MVQKGSFLTILEPKKGPKSAKMLQKISFLSLFGAPGHPKTRVLASVFPMFLRFGCDFRSKSHEISCKTRGFSLFETGEPLYFTCPIAVCLVFFSADSSKNAFSTQKVALKLELLAKRVEKCCKKRAFRRSRTRNPS